MSNLTDAVDTIAKRLLVLASEDAALRQDLRQLAEELLSALDEFEHTTDRSPEQEERAVVSDSSIENADTIATVSPPAKQEPPNEAPTRLPELTLGQSPPPTDAHSPTYPAHWRDAEPDLYMIEKRCRLKAEGSRWAATRRRLMMEAANYETEIAPKDQEIIARAKSIADCFLWMNHSTAPSPPNLKLYEEVARGFETLADAVSLVRKSQEEPELHQGAFEQSLDLLAEAQSALRMAIDGMDGPSDSDQAQVFAWLKMTASENQIFIKRHMRADDPASPDNLETLAARIEEVDSRLDEANRVTKKRRKLLGKVRHKLTLLEEQPEAAETHWEILIATVDELIEDGMPPSNRELRELLLPSIDEIPDSVEISPNFQLVLREIDRYLATYPPSTTKPVNHTTPEIQEVARLLKGNSLVLIGGDRRPGTEQAIQDAFGLKDVIWIETREHQSVDLFEPYVARPEVALVLLAIRWASHSYGDVKRFCDQYGKPLVRLPGGYSPNQIAAQILSQCSERLTNSKR